jgi:hypothetical protein
MTAKFVIVYVVQCMILLLLKSSKTEHVAETLPWLLQCLHTKQHNSSHNYILSYKASTKPTAATATTRLARCALQLLKKNVMLLMLALQTALQQTYQCLTQAEPTIWVSWYDELELAHIVSAHKANATSHRTVNMHNSSKELLTVMW